MRLTIKFAKLGNENANHQASNIEEILETQEGGAEYAVLDNFI